MFSSLFFLYCDNFDKLSTRAFFLPYKEKKHIKRALLALSVILWFFYGVAYFFFFLCSPPCSLSLFGGGVLRGGGSFFLPAHAWPLFSVPRSFYSYVRASIFVCSFFVRLLGSILSSFFLSSPPKNKTTRRWRSRFVSFLRGRSCLLGG